MPCLAPVQWPDRDGVRASYASSRNPRTRSNNGAHFEAQIDISKFFAIRAGRVRPPAGANRDRSSATRSLRKTPRVARRGHERALAVSHQFDQAVHAGQHDGHAEQHGFRRGDAEGFAQGRYDNVVGRLDEWKKLIVSQEE
jgi:flagellar biosynthesis/type III secretory pathway protein FliH